MNRNLFFNPTDILLPAHADMRRWSVIACDQFTADAGYWQTVLNLSLIHISMCIRDSLFIQALAPEAVVALSVATRPDCLPDAVIALLQRLNTEKPVWVELGLQTIHPQSAAYIRRGYDLPGFDDAVRRLRAAGLEVIVHQILGLPGETDAQMVQTARYIGQIGAQGIKLHLLHVLRGTDLAADYAACLLYTSRCV